MLLSLIEIEMPLNVAHQHSGSSYMEENQPQPFTITQMIADVEKYTGLPPGTIHPFFDAGQHWVFVLKTASIVETILKSAIFQRVSRRSYTSLGDLFNPHEQNTALREHFFRIPLNGDIGAISLAKSYDLISKKDEDFISSLLQVRNRYAHSILNHSKSILEIISERRDDNQVEAILRKLRYGNTWSDTPPRAPPGVLDIEFGLLMFLAGMSGRLAPLKPPPGGILGGLLSANPDPNPSDAASDDAEDA